MSKVSLAKIDAVHFQQGCFSPLLCALAGNGFDKFVEKRFRLNLKMIAANLTVSCGQQGDKSALLQRISPLCVFWYRSHTGASDA
jgi:hypothetical protein